MPSPCAVEKTPPMSTIHAVVDTSCIVKRYNALEPGRELLERMFARNGNLTIHLPHVCIAEVDQVFQRQRTAHGAPESPHLGARAADGEVKVIPRSRPGEQPLPGDAGERANGGAQLRFSVECVETPVDCEGEVVRHARQHSKSRASEKRAFPHWEARGSSTVVRRLPSAGGENRSGVTSCRRGGAVQAGEVIGEWVVEDPLPDGAWRCHRADAPFRKALVRRIRGPDTARLLAEVRGLARVRHPNVTTRTTTTRSVWQTLGPVRGSSPLGNRNDGEDPCGSED